MLILSFKDLNIKIKYDSDDSDILNEFYIPVLSEAKEYYRLSGFFSSTSLAVSAFGLENFIKKNGKMKLICSAILSDEDYDKIKEVYGSPEELIEEKFLFDLENISNKFIMDNLAALGFMLANGNLEIKIAIPKDGKSLFHPKLGILVDEDDNFISFSGSDNETANGWLYNIEEFKVFKEWIDGQDEYLMEDLNIFNKYWEDQTVKLDIIDIPDAIKKKLIQRAPKNSSDIEINNFFEEKNDVKKDSDEHDVILRDYQKKAISNWFDNGCQGIFNMATGTGKTFTALACFYDLIKDVNELLTIIVCPQKHLISQWESNLNKFNIFAETIEASGDNPNWRTQLLGLIGDMEAGLKERVVVFTTFNTFSDDDFIEKMNYYDGKSLLIVDEVHGVGSTEFRNGLLEKYTYRLGLSATPEIEDDFERNDLIYNYFKNIVYSYDLKKAIDNGFLTHYNYYPIFVDLNDEEMDLYKEYSFKIANLIRKKKKTIKDENNLQKFLIKRRDVINNAESKLDYLKTFLIENNDIKDLIIYCTGDQRPKVQNILNEFDISNKKFTGEESSKKINGKSERDQILELFANGYYRVLVAMKCLDEGVDVPSTQTALLLASTLNSRQHIQRRGRILRKSPGKDKANIYDLIIFPCIKGGSDSIKRIFENEQKRYDEYADLADNFSECSRKFIKKWEECR